MSTIHTPGPWRVGDAGATVFGPPNGTPAPEMIAQRIRNKANARLLAAAPEMLAALLAIADMRVDENTDHAQLSALCIGLARATVENVS